LSKFKKSHLCGLIALALIGCQSDESTTQEPVSVFVPYNVQELPKPNDGYGYDNDGTITGSGERRELLALNGEEYYQDYNNSYSALDGWGLCAEPILIPLQSINSDKRFPLDANSLQGNVVLMDDSGKKVDTKIWINITNTVPALHFSIVRQREYSGELNIFHDHIIYMYCGNPKTETISTFLYTTADGETVTEIQCCTY